MVKTVFKTGSGKRTGADGSNDYVVSFKAGEYVFHEGDLGTEMFIVQEGQVEVLKQTEGRERRLAMFDKGDFFGEMSVLEGMPRTATARATIDTKLLQINGSTFDQMLHTNPEIAVRMMRKLARRLRDMDRLLALRPATGPLPSASHEATPDMSMSVRSVGRELLFHPETDRGFHLSGDHETTVGREDPVTGINPDVDLTTLDTQRSTSRRHAKIVRDDDDHLYVLEEIGTTNGTFVNGVRVETGVPVEIRAGDELQFGLVKLELRSG